MQLLNFLERKFGRYAISNLTQYLIIGNVLTYLVVFSMPTYRSLFLLRGDLVLAGQWWRLVTMLFFPFADDPIWVVLTWYIYYLYGSALERTWGSFRYMVYILIAYAATVVSALVFPTETMGNGYIYGSVFLAFAYLYPDFKLLLFFIIPIKIKWLALLAWLGIAGSILFGPLASKILAIISVSNFFLFFGSDVGSSLMGKARGISRGARGFTEKQIAYMVCAVCHATEHDRKIFYTCDTCIPATRYCEDHIQDHKHKRLPN